MTKRCWIQAMVFPVTLMVLATSVQAQGKGKGQGAAKAEQKQERGGPKAEKQKSAQPVARGQTMSKQGGRPENTGQARAAENHIAHAATRGSGYKGNSLNKALRGSANEAPRASVVLAPNRGREISRLARDLTQREVRPSVLRFISSDRAAEHVAGGAISYAFARGIPDNTLVIVPSGRDVWVRNRKGDQLVVLDDDRARNLGVWEVSPLVEPVREGAPSFCRSGAGHPVFGRQWCLEKGFGLGTSTNVEWAAARDINDLVFVRPVTAGTVTRDALLSLLGPVAFDRLALHALTLGYTDPLTGVWRTDPNEPSVLLVNSGTFPIAEIVDGNRDGRPDLMLVALRPW